MKSIFKSYIIPGLITGLIYAGLMSGIEYADEGVFKTWKFLFYMLSFGLFMGLYNAYFLSMKNDKKDD